MKRFALLAALFLPACGLVYDSNREELLSTASEADFGPAPPKDHRKQEAALIRTTLKDPDSAKFDFGDVTRDAIPETSWSMTPILVWTTSVKVNAKNGFGGYTGYRPYHFAWRDGRILAFSFPIATSRGVASSIWKYTSE